MEDDYNWNIIMLVAIPMALIEAAVFYFNFKNAWRWIILVTGLLLTGTLVYLKDRKKGNIFTAAAIVFLTALVVKFLKGFGWI